MSRRALLFVFGWLACTEPVPPAAAPVVVAQPLPLDAPWVDPVLPEPRPGRYAMRELRITWAGASGALGPVTRTELEARVLARQLERRLRDGEPFDGLVREMSDAPTRSRGGWLGAFDSGTYAAGVEASVAGVAPGAIAPLVRTEAGYHLLQRVPLDEVVVGYTLYAWRGARGASVGRDKASAEFLSGEAVAALRAGARPDGLKADRASPAEGVQVGRDQWAPSVEQAAFALAVGAVSDPIDTPSGFLVVKRIR